MHTQTILVNEAGVFETLTKPDFRKASDAALRLLKKYGYNQPPIDPEKIAEAEDLRVIYADFEHPFDQDVSGFFELDSRRIYINNDINPNRITFTIAHELAHYFLHQEYIKSTDYRPMPRRDDYPDGKPVEEVEADTFAANLLVPLFLLKGYSGIANISELSSLFFVSEDVIRYRLDLLSRFPGLARA